MTIITIFGQPHKAEASEKPALQPAADPPVDDPYAGVLIPKRKHAFVALIASCSMTCLAIISTISAAGILRGWSSMIGTNVIAGLLATVSTGVAVGMHVAPQSRPIALPIYAVVTTTYLASLGVLMPACVVRTVAAIRAVGEWSNAYRYYSDYSLNELRAFLTALCEVNIAWHAVIVALISACPCVRSLIKLLKPPLPRMKVSTDDGAPEVTTTDNPIELADPVQTTVFKLTVACMLQSCAVFAVQAATRLGPPPDDGPYLFYFHFVLPSLCLLDSALYFYTPYLTNRLRNAMITCHNVGTITILVLLLLLIAEAWVMVFDMIRYGWCLESVAGSIALVCELLVIVLAILSMVASFKFIRANEPIMKESERISKEKLIRFFTTIPRQGDPARTPIETPRPPPIVHVGYVVRYHRESVGGSEAVVVEESEQQCDASTGDSGRAEEVMRHVSRL